MYLLFDIGGTKMRLAVSSDNESFEDPKIIPTPKQFEEGVELFIKIAKEISKGSQIRKVAGGLPGVLNKDKSELLTAPNLGDWVNKPVRKMLEESLKAKVYLENDTDLIGLGEAVNGAGRGFKIVSYITVSTGVGGSRIVDGRIDTVKFGMEPGHQILITDDYSDLEELVGGASLEEKEGKKASEIVDKNIWDKVTNYLSIGLNNTIVHWSPDVVVLGGGLISGNQISIEKVKENLIKTLKIFPEIPEIKKAELGDVGGLYGALAYLKQLHLS